MMKGKEDSFLEYFWSGSAHTHPILASLTQLRVVLTAGLTNTSVDPEFGLLDAVEDLTNFGVDVIDDLWTYRQNKLKLNVDSVALAEHVE